MLDYYYFPSYRKSKNAFCHPNMCIISIFKRRSHSQKAAIVQRSWTLKLEKFCDSGLLLTILKLVPMLLNISFIICKLWIILVASCKD